MYVLLCWNRLRERCGVVALLCLALWGTALPAEGQQAATPKFETHDVLDGLTANEASAILQDSQGYLWVGTWIGLHRYDGTQFRAFLRDRNDPRSLANSWIWKVYEDRAGTLWVATNGGLSRFDRETESFVTYQHDPDDPGSLSHNEVYGVAEDAEGKLWLGTQGGGLNHFDPATERFTHVRHDPAHPDGLISDDVYALTVNPDGTLWVGTRRGLNHYDPATETFISYPPSPDPARSGPLDVYSLHQDRSGVLWVGTFSDGLYRFDPATETFTHFAASPADPRALGHRWVLSIAEDLDSTLWFGTDGGGLHRFDPATETFARYTYDPADPRSLPDDRVLSLAVDRTGVLWAGTYRGISRRYPLSQHVAEERYRSGDEEGLNSNDIVAFLEDHTGALWVATDGGGLNRRDPVTGTFTHFQHDPADPGSLGNDAVLSLAEDDQGALWVGTYDGLYRRDPQSGRFERFRAPAVQGVRPEMRVVGGLDYLDGHLWAAVYNGIFDIETATGRAVHYAPEEPAGMYKRPLTVYAEPSGSVWVGAFNGRFGHLDTATGRFTRIREDGPDAEALQWGIVLSILRDRSGTLWVGGGKGLNRVEEGPTQGDVTAYSRVGGLSNTPVDAIIEDAQGRLWITTVHGLSRLDLQTQTLLHYDARDGLSGGGALYQSPRSGRVYAGGTQGYYVFDSEDIDNESPPGRPVFTGLRLQNERVGVGDDNGLLDRPLALIDALHLRYDDRVVTFEFGALDYRAPTAHRYAVRLDGFDDDWREVGGQREATFTNLSPGHYTFRVRAAGRDGMWEEDEATLAVVVAPPLWGTWQAYLGYLALVMGGLALVYRNRRNRTALRHRAELERLEADQLRQLDRAKSRFFANVSHEFRTPLTLTLGPLDDVLGGEHGAVPDAARDQLALARRSAGRVLDLINQILDIARLEAGRTELHARRLDLGVFVASMMRLFRPLADRKAITFDADLPAAPVEVWADEETLSKALANLLSNALKFTPEGGTVRVTVRTDDGTARVEVRDSGPGIPAAEVPYVFDRFHRASEGTTRVQPGTGIGLALAREIVDLHGGTLAVESEEGFGSTFTLALPLGRVHLAPEQIDETLPADALPSLSVALPTEPHGDGAPAAPSDSMLGSETGDGEFADMTTVLVVEDHADVRAYVRRHLEPAYRVIEAANGEEGVAQARALLPDLVISDVMMPGLDGLGLCRALRSDPETDFLPIILLTARAAPEDRLEGLGQHCDAYLTKPFDPRELKAQVDNLIASRKRLRERFAGAPAEPAAASSGDGALHPAPVEVASADAVFLGVVRQAIEVRLGDDTFSVSDLAEAVGMSRGHLHRQLKTLAGRTPSETIRAMRLERAAQLLEAKAGTVSEVAYAVGFKSVAHFSNSFENVFGCRPSGYAATD